MNMAPESGMVPDRWVVIKYYHDKGHSISILCGWYGSYTTGDSWRRSSAIKKVEKVEDGYIATTASGSTYVLHTSRIGTNRETDGLVHALLEAKKNGQASLDIITESEEIDSEFTETFK